MRLTSAAPQLAGLLFTLTTLAAIPPDPAQGQTQSSPPKATGPRKPSANAASPPGGGVPGDSPDDHEKRIRELEETVRQLTRDQSQVQATLDTQKSAKPIAGWADGFILNSPDGQFKLKIGAYAQTDGRFFVDDTANNSTGQFLIRRARLDLQGTVFRYFDFRLMPDFGGSSVQLYDAYVDLNYIPEAKLRVGKYKAPIGLERLQSATSLMFVERGLPTNLVPSRDIGAQVFGEFWNGALTYAGGIFNGAPDLANPTGDVNDDKDFAGRLFAQPFAPTSVVFLRGLGLGVAGSYGNEGGTKSNPDVASYKSTAQNTIFSYRSGSPASLTNTVVSSGSHSRFAPQAYYYYGPFGLLSEYTFSDEEVSLKGNQETVDATAWQVATSYVLTGEPASYRGVSPFRPFDPAAGKWGAFELAARGGQLQISNNAFLGGADSYADPETSVRQASEWVLGLNWYLTKNIKFVLNYANTYFVGGAKGGDRPTEKAFLSRVQLAF